MPTVVKFRLSKNGVRKLFSSSKASVSKGLEEVLDRYSEKVEYDVLEEFLREMR